MRAPVVHVLESTPETVSAGTLDPRRPAALTIDSGDIVSCPNAWTQWGNQAHFGMSFADREPLRRQLPAGPYSNLGPVEIRGAQPGDVLVDQTGIESALEELRVQYLVHKGVTEALRAAVSRVWAGEPPGTLHLTLNAVIDDGAAEPVVSSVLLLVIPAGAAVSLASAQIRQVVGRVGGEWRIRSRTIRVGATGPLGSAGMGVPEGHTP